MERHTLTLKSMLVLVTVGILGGIAPIFMKFALADFTPAEIAFSRFFGASLILIPAAVITRSFRMSKRQVLPVFAASLLFAGNINLFILGLPLTTSIASQILYLLVPALVLVLSIALFHERIRARHLISIAAGILGGVLLVGRAGADTFSTSLGTAQGNGVVLGAVLSWSLYLVLSKKLSKTCSPFTLLVANCLTTAVVSGIILIWSNVNIVRTYMNASSLSISHILLLIFTNSLLFFFLYQWLIKQVKPFTASLSTYIGLLATALTAATLLHEQINAQLILSTLLLLISSYISLKK